VRLEAGWPRTPADGIVPGGGLARARISHFGDAKANDELILVYEPDSNARANSSGTPQWHALEDGRTRTPLTEARLRRHIAKLRT